MKKCVMWGVVRRFLMAAFFGFLPTVSWAISTTFSAPGAPEELVQRLNAASSVMAAETNELDTAQELIAASLSDYRTLIQVLYDEGYFSPTINIKIDGREAASISLLDPPGTVKRIDISINTGRPFRFGIASVAPLAPDTKVPEGFAPNLPANTAILQDAANAGVIGWRNVGHAKATVADQRIVANHSKSVLDAEITLMPGPKLKFGNLAIPDDSTVRPEAIAKIAGFPKGETYSPHELQKVSTRLRRTGSFSSISIREAEYPNPDGTLDFETTVIDQIPRRISFGVEVSSRNGLDLSTKWTHRNVFGAAERLQLEARVRNIGGEENIDGLFAARLDRPATMGPDDNLFYLAVAERKNEPHYSLARGFIGAGVRRVFSEDLYSELSVNGGKSRSDDAFGKRDFDLITFPFRTQLDKRDNRVSATRGYFLDTLFIPFLGLSETASGMSAMLDARGYLSVTSSNSVVLAGRVQVGSVLGAKLSETSPEFLFFSGGAGTVRGQPYQSLGIPVGTGIAGGRSLLAFSAEIRGRITEKISLVGFYDFGAVDSNQFVGTDSIYHSGAGLGLRYDLGGLGPLRFDLALPVEGPTGDGLQFYLGIGQAF